MTANVWLWLPLLKKILVPNLRIQMVNITSETNLSCLHHQSRVFCNLIDNLVLRVTEGISL